MDLPTFRMPRLSGISALAPLILRVMIGIVFLAHGLDKLGNGVGVSFAPYLQSLGVPAPSFMAWVVTLTETVGGALLIAGFLTRLAAAALAIEMIVTTLLVKVDVGFLSSQARGAGAELDLLLLAGSAAVLALGPGVVSVDCWLGLEREASGIDASTVRSTRRRRRMLG